MNALIPPRYFSLKTLSTIITHIAHIFSYTKKLISGRAIFFGAIGQWYISIGSTNIPSVLVKTNTEAAAELCKALHAFGAQSHTSLITLTMWIAAEGTYVVAVDLKRQPHQSFRH